MLTKIFFLLDAKNSKMIIKCVINMIRCAIGENGCVIIKFPNIWYINGGPISYLFLGKIIKVEMVIITIPLISNLHILLQKKYNIMFESSF